jgi:hypothetical protein
MVEQAAPQFHEELAQHLAKTLRGLRSLMSGNVNLCCGHVAAPARSYGAAFNGLQERMARFTDFAKMRSSSRPICWNRK